MSTTQSLVSNLSSFTIDQLRLLYRTFEFMSPIDNFINKRIPGSIAFKSFAAAVLLCSAVAYPVFKKPPEESRQGHDYLSSDKPEVIRASQEQLRKEYRQNRNKAAAEEPKQE
jgi:hypothetical protein